MIFSLTSENMKAPDELLALGKQVRERNQVVCALTIDTCVLFHSPVTHTLSYRTNLHI